MHLDIGQDKSLKITYGAMIAALVLMFGIAAWVTFIEIRGASAESKIKEIENKYEDQSKKISDGIATIDKRLYRIEILLENKSTKKGE